MLHFGKQQEILDPFVRGQIQEKPSPSIPASDLSLDSELDRLVHNL